MKDLYLKFASDREARSVLYTTDKDNNLEPNYKNIDIIGEIMRETGQTYKDRNGYEFPIVETIEGWHVNIRLEKGEDEKPLKKYMVKAPKTPHRKWAD